MAYIVIEDFRQGLDRRKMAVASPSGSLQALSNAHITRGGELEKRKSFVALHALPPGQTYGLAGANGVLYTFGSDASPAVPTGITYQRLEHPDGEAMTALIAAEFYDGKIFSVARYANGDVIEFYDGVVVPDWVTGSGADVAGQQATSLLTLRDKMYATAQSVLFFSAISAPDEWHNDLTGPPVLAGAGFKNMANQSAGSEALTALGRYQNLMAVFARRNTQIWQMDSDPDNNIQRQVLENIGTFAPGTVISFGDVDVFFLSDTGVRSLRSRDSSNQAGISDVGTPIDDEIIAQLKTMTEDEKIRAVAVIDPIDGRYILALGTRCYVFSYYGTARISAWSRYDLGFAISDFVALDGRLWARGGDNVYLVGGVGGDDYDSSEVVVELPYIDGRSIATFKNFTGIDVACEGEWVVYANFDPLNPETYTKIATVTGTTVAYPSIGMQAHSPIIKLKLTCIQPGGAKLSKVIVHYDAAESD